MSRILRLILMSAVILLVLLLTLWGTLALWYRLPAPELLRFLVSGLFIASGIATIVAQFGAYQGRMLFAFSFLFACLVFWWGTITPSAEGNWSPDVARQVTGTIDGNLLTLTNVREFEWRTDDDFTPNWTTRTYDLDQLKTVDLFLSYWAGPQMAHFVLSFGFSDGQYLAWSIEVRRQIGGEFSPIADAFKANPLVILATVERDVIGVRSNVRGEDVQLFRLRTRPKDARALLMEYVTDANSLAKKPQWYNSLTTNCTTVVFKMLKAIGDSHGFDWRMIVNGYLPDYAYERGVLNTDYPLTELRKLGRIAKRGKEAGLGPAFSKTIRKGTPSPD